MSSSSTPDPSRDPVPAAPPGYPDFGPDPVEGVRLFTVPAVPTAVVRAKAVPMATIGEFFDSAFGAAFPALFATGVSPIAAAFALYTRVTEGPEAEADLEIGFPLARPLDVHAEDPVEVDGMRVVASELPACRLAVTSHLGPYDDLGRAWGAFMGGITATDHTPAVPFWECYVTEPSPDVDPATLRTDLCCVVRPADEA